MDISWFLTRFFIYLGINNKGYENRINEMVA